MSRVTVVNLAEAPLEERGHGEAFLARHAALGRLLGAVRLGCRLTVVLPGRRAWPYHCHHANEELFVVLAGRGRLRTAAGARPIGPGDVILAPAGGPETAHQIVNDSGAELRYLCVSTMAAPDVTQYPDSGKLAVFAGSAPGGDRARRTLAAAFRAADAVDYWDGEG